ncbi:hypothetical protein C1645_827473 [Glomus cerebriforme]|uniref:Uncharacterized protein n=1 Tax=Glomus cerebriforme TaxID=658196 RepID=A0A397SSV7_9GLOM|nr:hypothetical protein C1645_827473 [Glomus cerebriforme]
MNSFCNYRSTEPIWFRFFRGFIAIILTTIIIYYSIIQLHKIDKEASTTIKLDNFDNSTLNISMCTRISNEMNIIGLDQKIKYTPYCQSGNLNFDSSWSNSNIIISFNNDTNGNIFSSPNNLLFLSFESYQFNNPTAIFNRTKAKLIMYLLKQLPIQLEPNEIQIGIYSHSNPMIVRSEITQIYDLSDFISNVGGFYGSIAGIFYLLFGMQKHEPWGLVQKYFLSCMPLEKVNKRPEGSSLETRVQILETLLRDYYLDDFYLEKVKNIIINHNKFLARYNEMNGQNNDNPELNTSSV